MCEKSNSLVEILKRIEETIESGKYGYGESEDDADEEEET